MKFGELTVGRRAIAAVTNSTRAVMCSGDTPGTNTMDYITMASEGNAIDFGDINDQNSGYGAGASTVTLAIASGLDNAGIAADIESDINTALGSDKVTVEWTGSNYKFMSNLGTSSGSVVIASPAFTGEPLYSNPGR